MPVASTSIFYLLDTVVFCGFVEFKLLHFTGVTTMVDTIKIVI